MSAPSPRHPSPHHSRATNDHAEPSTYRPSPARAASLQTYSFKARAASQPAGERVPIHPASIASGSGSQPTSGRGSPAVNGAAAGAGAGLPGQGSGSGLGDRYGVIGGSRAPGTGRFAGALAGGNVTRANSFSAAEARDSRNPSLIRTLSSHTEENPSHSSSASPYPTFSPTSSPATSPATTTHPTTFPPAPGQIDMSAFPAPTAHSPPRAEANISRSRSQSLAGGQRPDKDRTERERERDRFMMPLSALENSGSFPRMFDKGWDVSPPDAGGNQSPFSRHPPSLLGTGVTKRNGTPGESEAGPASGLGGPDTSPANRFKFQSDSPRAWGSSAPESGSTPGSGSASAALSSSVAKALGGVQTHPTVLGGFDSSGGKSGSSSRRHSVSVVGGPGGRRDFMFDFANLGMTSPPNPFPASRGLGASGLPDPARDLGSDLPDRLSNALSLEIDQSRIRGRNTDMDSSHHAYQTRSAARDIPLASSLPGFNGLAEPRGLGSRQIKDPFAPEGIYGLGTSPSGSAGAGMGAARGRLTSLQPASVRAHSGDSNLGSGSVRSRFSLDQPSTKIGASGSGAVVGERSPARLSGRAAKDSPERSSVGHVGGVAELASSQQRGSGSAASGSARSGSGSGPASGPGAGGSLGGGTVQQDMLDLIGPPTRPGPSSPRSSQAGQGGQAGIMGTAGQRGTYVGSGAGQGQAQGYGRMPSYTGGNQGSGTDDSTAPGPGAIGGPAVYDPRVNPYMPGGGGYMGMQGMGMGMGQGGMMYGAGSGRGGPYGGPGSPMGMYAPNPYSRGMMPGPGPGPGPGPQGHPGMGGSIGGPIGGPIGGSPYGYYQPRPMGHPYHGGSGGGQGYSPSSNYPSYAPPYGGHGPGHNAMYGGGGSGSGGPGGGYYSPSSPPHAQLPLPPGVGGGVGVGAGAVPGFSSLSLSDLGKGVPLSTLSPSTPLYIVSFKAGRRDVFYCPDPTLLISTTDRVIVEADRGSDLGTVIFDQLTPVLVREWQERQATAALLSGASQHQPPGVTMGVTPGKVGAGDTKGGVGGPGTMGSVGEKRASGGSVGGASGSGGGGEREGGDASTKGGGGGGGGARVKEGDLAGADLNQLLSGCGPSGNAFEGGIVQRGPLAKEIMPKRIFAKSAQGPDEQARMLEKRKDEYEAMMICRDKVAERGLPMQIVDAEYQWDRRKLTFYFKADRRVDFRELTKENFRIFKSRIWMSMVAKDDPR